MLHIHASYLKSEYQVHLNVILVSVQGINMCAIDYSNMLE